MPSVELLFGPMLIGVYLNTILYGVLYLVICETINTCFDVAYIYEPLVVRYGNITVLEPPAAAISTPIQLFVAWRIKIISGSRLLAAIIYFFALCSFIGSLAATISASFFPKYEDLQKFKPAIITWLTSSAAADVAITVSLVWSLYKRRTGHAKTNYVIDRIIRLTVQTGLITAVSAVIDVVVNFIWDFALGKLYTNSLLSTLNARKGWGNLNHIEEEDNVLVPEGGMWIQMKMKILFYL
ncbi:hypothetical protein BU17DRAFT_77415 [Hysterangium stoloniferum]|nr:hypothetical protein BU17DRAFT_77415 [Hysterangium stoloniferum]